MASLMAEELGHVGPQARVEALRPRIAALACRLHDELARLRSELADLPWESPDEQTSLGMTCEPTGSSDVAVQLPPRYRDSCPERGPWLPVNDPSIGGSLIPVSALLPDGTTKPAAKNPSGDWHGWDAVTGKLEVIYPIACRAIPPLNEPNTST
jgi:hypothetical protein